MTTSMEGRDEVGRVRADGRMSRGEGGEGEAGGEREGEEGEKGSGRKNLTRGSRDG